MMVEEASGSSIEACIPSCATQDGYLSTSPLCSRILDLMDMTSIAPSISGKLAALHQKSCDRHEDTKFVFAPVISEVEEYSPAY